MFHILYYLDTSLSRCPHKITNFDLGLQKFKMSHPVKIAFSLAVASGLGYFIYRTIDARNGQSASGEEASSKDNTTIGLTSRQIEIIKSTAPILEEHGTTITTVFYNNMLTAHPELNNVFNTTNQLNGHQPRALAGSLLAYVSHIDDLSALSSAVELICNKHASLYIRPEDYKIVGKFLLEAMKEVLRDALTEEVQSAWEAAYWVLAHILVNRENELYTQCEEGWTDWRDFRVCKKIPESDEITSFYLRPVDGKPLPAFRPGQYISVRVDVPELKHAQPRQYSLSDKPRSDYYRISVKKESELRPENSETDNVCRVHVHPGYVSSILHDSTEEGDIVQVSHPFGEFFLSGEEATHPIVLLSAGVGVTPLMSILNTIISTKSARQRKIHFIHGSRTDESRAFRNHVQSLAQRDKHPGFQTTFFTTKPSSSFENDKQGVNCHYRSGRINVDKLDSVKDLYLDDSSTEFYICGPEKFMRDTEDGLRSRGISAEQIKMELFGTGGLSRHF